LNLTHPCLSSAVPSPALCWEQAKLVGQQMGWDERELSGPIPWHRPLSRPWQLPWEWGGREMGLPASKCQGPTALAGEALTSLPLPPTYMNTSKIPTNARTMAASEHMVAEKPAKIIQVSHISAESHGRASAVYPVTKRICSPAQIGPRTHFPTTTTRCSRDPPRTSG
jgi:hypothetical protein